MEIKVERKYKLKDYTIGKMYVDGVYFCDTLEDVDRGMEQGMRMQDLQAIKIKHETAIPRGKYKVVITWSNHFKQMMPLLLNVPAFDGVRIHSGNTKEHTSGCILVGENKKKGMVLNSRIWYKRLFDKIKAAKENVTIEIY